MKITDGKKATQSTPALQMNSLVGLTHVLQVSALPDANVYGDLGLTKVRA